MRSPIHAFLCAVHLTLSRIELISYHFGDSKTLQHTTILRWIVINLSQSLWDSFFHNSISRPQQDFPFKHLAKYMSPIQVSNIIIITHLETDKVKHTLQYYMEVCLKVRGRGCSCVSMLSHQEWVRTFVCVRISSSASCKPCNAQRCAKVASISCSPETHRPTHSGIFQE